jgi:ABC-2 type transport system ATP-binding protein
LSPAWRAFRLKKPATALMRVAAFNKRYGDQCALADVSFAVNAGEALGLIGPNGAGKTTLLEAIAGLVPVDSGEVLGATGRCHRQNAASICSIFRTECGRGPTNMRFGFWNFSPVSMVGLAPTSPRRLRLSDWSRCLGNGRRVVQRICTPHDVGAGAYRASPAVAMDEPFDGFDLKQTRQMTELLRKMLVPVRTLILSIHQLSDAERVCDRFVLLTDRHVRSAGTLDELSVRAGCPTGRLEDIFLALA